jgi:hypothetical protein
MIMTCSTAASIGSDSTSGAAILHTIFKCHRHVCHPLRVRSASILIPVTPRAPESLRASAVPSRRWIGFCHSFNCLHESDRVSRRLCRRQATRHMRQRVGNATALGMGRPAQDAVCGLARGAMTNGPRPRTERGGGRTKLGASLNVRARIRSDRYFNNVSNGTKFAGFGGATAFFKTLKTRCCNGEDVTKSS